MSDTPDLARMRVEMRATIIAVLDKFHDGQREKKADAILAAQRPLLDRIAELEGEGDEALREADNLRDRAIERTTRAQAAEAQVSALQAQVDGLREGVAKAIRVLSNAETHELTRVVDARDILVLASQPPADEAAKGEG